MLQLKHIRLTLLAYTKHFIECYHTEIFSSKQISFIKRQKILLNYMQYMDSPIPQNTIQYNET